MKEYAHRDLLQPSLLDRLTDDSSSQNKKPSGTRVQTSRQAPSTDGFVLNAQRLREIVKRDLSWLLNTSDISSTQDLSKYPEVEKSVLNYGVHDLTGSTISDVDIRSLERSLKKQILFFEPRILKNTLKIEIDKSDTMSVNALRFRIECDIWGQPAPEHIYLNSELDLESGAFEFVDSRLG